MTQPQNTDHITYKQWWQLHVGILPNSLNKPEKSFFLTLSCLYHLYKPFLHYLIYQKMKLSLAPVMPMSKWFCFPQTFLSPKPILPLDIYHEKAYINHLTFSNHNGSLIDGTESVNKAAKKGAKCQGFCHTRPHIRFCLSFDFVPLVLVYISSTYRK